MDIKRRLNLSRRPVIICVAGLVLVLAGELGFYLGQYYAFKGMGAEPDSYQSMQAELISVENALRTRSAQLEIVETQREVDRQALEMVRKEMAAQQEEIVALEEGLSFYQGLMAPGDLADGLHLHDLELLAGERQGQYFYRIVLQQEARKHALLKGNLDVVIAGQSNGEAAEYSLADLSEDVESGSVALQFRYFQSIEGRLSLPEGFEPAEVRVHASTRKPHKFEVIQSYPWQLKERFTHVGK